MPLEDCERDGKKGKRWGGADAGFCYTGEGAESKAKQQGKAIKRSEAIESGREKPGK